MKAFVGIGLMYTLLKLYRSYRQMKPQGNLMPKTWEDVEKRNEEVNVWATTEVMPTPVQFKCKTITSKKLQQERKYKASYTREKDTIHAVLRKQN